VSIAQPRLLLVDNYDSFTYNLVQAFLVLGAEVLVYRNDEIRWRRRWN
jgi:anthranilate/para-aminobenzoate synthase component II